MGSPANSFNLFEKLPKELRLYIWKHALPGPRIILVNRHFTGDEDDENVSSSQASAERPLGAYFSSLSPGQSITSLAHACKESRAVVKQHYSLIFPSSGTWISFSTDYFYLSWDHKHFRMCHFSRPSALEWPEKFRSKDYSHPGFKDIASQVKNLVIHVNDSYGGIHDTWVIRNLLPVFPRAEVLIFVDQLYNQDEAQEELVWLTGDLGQEFEMDRLHEIRARLWISMLWSDSAEYGICHPFNLEIIRKVCEHYQAIRTGHIQKRHRIPRIARKSVISSTLKDKLLKICGSEENLGLLAGLDWETVDGYEYTGGLNLSQQIAYLNLVLSRISLEEALDPNDPYSRDMLRDRIPSLVELVEALVTKELTRELTAEEDEMAQRLMEIDD